MIGTCLCSKASFSSKIFTIRRINTKFIRSESRYSSNLIKESRDLPWLQHSKDVFKKEPFFHRIVGHLLFRSALKSAKHSMVTWPAFSYGASEAIKRIVQCINCHDENDELQHFIGSALLRQYKTAFEQLEFENKRVHLHIEGPVRMHISGARIVIGEVEPGDEHVINVLGQKTILSTTEMEEFQGKVDSAVSAFRSGTEHGKTAFYKSLRFQYDVKFELYERFCLIDAGSVQSNEEEIDPVHSYHRWRFETKLTPGVLELDWNVIDVDDFLKNKFMLPEDSESQH